MEKAKLNAAVFDVEPNVGVIHEVVRAEMAALRRGTASTKTRSEVRGGGAKPWRQKGTGRARAGSIRMPHWTGGGVAFGPRPRTYDFKVNRKARSKAMKMALSARVREGRLKVVDNLSFEEPRTAAAVAVLDGLEISYPLLVLLDESDTNAMLAFRNLPRVGVTVPGELDVNDVMAARTVLTTAGVIEQLNQRLGGVK
ncbi:MAG: 50S ribosomal protein L4 [Thermoleophilia bacterium]|nr:50S ribosomal protein L4 [Thermoleophilia bacterium]